MYLIGEATPLIARAFEEVTREADTGDIPAPESYGDLESAVRAAARNAHPGEVVLLAPACASFDQYEDFEARGEHFRRIVAALARESA